MEDSPKLSLDAKVRKLGTVIFWKSDCFFKFNNYTLSSSSTYESYNPVACKIIVIHQEKQESEVRNNQSRTSKQAPRRDCLRSISYVILRHMPTQDLRTKQNSLRSFMIWAPPQSKFHHLEKKKRGSNGPCSIAMLIYQRVPIRNGDFPIAKRWCPHFLRPGPSDTAAPQRVSGRSPTSPPRLLWAPAHPCPRGRRRPILARIRDSAPGGKPRNPWELDHGCHGFTMGH